MAIFKRKIEQCSQHLGRQILGDMFHPIESLANRQAFQNFDDSTPDQALHFFQISGRHHWLHGLALHIVPRWIHGNKVFGWKIVTEISQKNIGLG